MGKDNLDKFKQQKWLEKDTESRFYIYSQAFEGKQPQYGLLSASSIEDYEKGLIKKHEKTLQKKEEDRTRLNDAQNANIEPVFLTYKNGDAISEKVCSLAKSLEPIYSIQTDDSVQHNFWKIDASENRFFVEEFKNIDCAYVADGHHRTAAAYNVGKQRREQALKQGLKVSGEEDFNYIMSLIYPAKELQIMDYNRIVTDLNGLTGKQLIVRMVEVGIDISVVRDVDPKPKFKHTFSMLLEGVWFSCAIPEHLINQSDPVKRLDVQILNDLVIDGLLGIKDVRTDKRIEFVGGIRGIGELERRYDRKVAFAMYPVSIEDLMSVADAGLIMPPKSTWFEPKPRSGFCIRQFDI
ncbi:hypothetical protein FGO68_gene13843 [Halteria grandinella]|uniref:DUF1015 domain-containing protein n=1 Tax=Halteria grandinella TaxID=5974 RepID=A0A8J8NMT6_HALGN|nr:hypothetical protein FGO68_gene13843 [Halteria grandinella]